jgi:hypothetical protein
MKIFEANIPYTVVNFFKNQAVYKRTLTKLNSELKQISGINDFFSKTSEIAELYEKLNQIQSIIEEPDRTEYGDFQTNLQLAVKVCRLIENKEITPEIIIEPTCGKGNFLLAAIQTFNSIKELFGIEIHKPYIWQTKFNILDFYLNNREKSKPNIQLINANIFDFNLKKTIKYKHQQITNFGQSALGNKLNVIRFEI